jgi:hypothetical protein
VTAAVPRGGAMGVGLALGKRKVAGSASAIVFDDRPPFIISVSSGAIVVPARCRSRARLAALDGQVTR